MNTLVRPPKGLTWARTLSLLGASLVILPLVCAGGRAQPRRDRETTTVTGVVREFTAAPKGEVDGAILEDGTVIHWPPHLEDRFKDLAAKGDRVRVTGWMETGPRGDTHLEVSSLTNLRTRDSATNTAPPPPPPPPLRRGPGPKGPIIGEERTVTGVVREFTTAPKGEIDGLTLDDGTVVHWPPHKQNQFKDIAAKGDRVRVNGWMETGRRGDTHLETRSIVNLRTNASRTNKDAPPARRATPDRPGDRDQRLRDLEDQVEQLRKEIQRLRRDG